MVHFLVALQENEQGDNAKKQSRAKQKRQKKRYCYSRAGNRTLVPRVTGEDTSHYTTPEEMCFAEPEGVRTLATFVTRT